MHWSHLGLHAGNVLFLLAYLVRDILWLRILTIVATLSLMVYYSCCQATPLYEAIAWNSLFIAVNLVQIGLLIWERRPVFVGDRELQIYRDVFSALSAREFVKLLTVADWKQVAPEAKLLSQNESVDALMLIAQGTGGVQIDGRHVADIRVNQFLGEMAFLTGAPASADVIAQTELQVLSWPLDKLRDFLVEYPQIHFKLRGVLGADLVEKLRQRGNADAHPSLI